jgi:acylphosphatase
MASSYRFVVRGRVQGVGFRYWATGEARAHRICGFVRNRDDGAVEGVATGAETDLERFRERLRRGPPAARVEEVEWRADAEAPAGAGFVIRR